MHLLYILYLRHHKEAAGAKRLDRTTLDMLLLIYQCKRLQNHEEFTLE